MNLSTVSLRALFFALALFFMTSYTVGLENGFSLPHLLMGIALSLAVMALLFAFELLFNRFHLRSLNLATLGLLFGYLLGKALLLVVGTLMDVTYLGAALTERSKELIETLFFLIGTYCGALLTLRFSNEIYLSIPFVKFEAQKEVKSNILLDRSALADTRLADLAATGLLNRALVVPKFVIQEIYALLETGDEMTRSTARRSIDILKKLQTMEGLSLKIQETNFPDLQDDRQKLVRLARLSDAHILTGDLSAIPLSIAEGTQVISMNALSGALKPLMHEGEMIRIKIQRTGKEPRQGVGYLDDGTMVVVNGAAAMIGKTVSATVLSIKASSSGRMIFCNLSGEHHGLPSDDEDENY